MSEEQRRRIRGEQDIIVRYEPDRALVTLPRLLTRRGDRARLLTLLDNDRLPTGMLRQGSADGQGKWRCWSASAAWSWAGPTAESTA